MAIAILDFGSEQLNESVGEAAPADRLLSRAFLDEHAFKSPDL